MREGWGVGGQWGPGNFPGPGVGCKDSRGPRPCAPVRPRLPAKDALARLFFCAKFLIFCRSLAAVASMAKALEVGPVEEQVQAPTVRDDVVNLRCSARYAVPRAFRAPGLPHQLHGADISAPDWQVIEPVPMLCVCAPNVWSLWLMRGAEPVAHQLTASGMSARPQRLISQGLSPPWRNKNAP